MAGRQKNTEFNQLATYNKWNKGKCSTRKTYNKTEKKHTTKEKARGKVCKKELKWRTAAMRYSRNNINDTDKAITQEIIMCGLEITPALIRH